MSGLKKIANASYNRYKKATDITPPSNALAGVKNRAVGALAVPKKVLGMALSTPTFAAGNVIASAVSRLKNRPNMYSGVGS